MPLAELRFSLRGLRRSKLNTLAIVVTIGLGLGATVAVYSVVHAVLLRPLPFPNPDALVWVAERNDKLDLPAFANSALNYQSWLEDPGPVTPMAAFGFATYNLTGEGEPEVLTGGTLSASAFETLGIVPVAGRAFTADEDRPGGPRVAMIGEGLWRRRFGGSPAILGRTVALDGTAFTVVGIAPAALAVVSPGDVWTPIAIDAAKERRLNHVITVLGRLRPGVTLEQAQVRMDGVAARVASRYPEMRDWGIRLVGLHDVVVPATVKTALVTLLAAVLAVLLIAAANISNLMLARALARGRDTAVRIALGASRGRVLAQLLLESLLLAVFGGALGLLAAVGALRWATLALPPNLLPTTDIGMDRPVLLFAVGLTLVTGLAFGLAPAWQIAGAGVAGTLRAAGRGTVGGGRRLRSGLVVVEITLATALLAVAGLLVTSARRLGSVELGFQPDHLLTFQVNRPGASEADRSRARAFYRDLVPALNALPGVTGVAISSGLPMGAGNLTATPVRPVGDSPMATGEALTVDWRLASPDYFRVLGIPLVRGRTFTASDDAAAAPTVIVSRLLAQRFFGREDVVGRSIVRVGDGKTFTVVGVVGDVRLTALNRLAPAMYYSAAARTWPLMDVAVRADGAPESIVAGVRQRVRELDAGVPLTNVQPMSYWVRSSGAQSRLDAGLLAALASLALVIATLGIYGVLAHAVVERRGEIGVRMALGAPVARVVRQFLGEGLVLGVIGVALGLGAALAAGRALRSLVFGVTPNDPGTLVLVGAVLLGTTAAASLVPALRAARVDPTDTLRDA